MPASRERIGPAGGSARHETRVGDDHHHIVCRACGASEEIDWAPVAAPRPEPGSAAGFVVDEAEVTFWGLCPDCQRCASATPELGRAGAK